MALRYQWSLKSPSIKYKTLSLATTQGHSQLDHIIDNHNSSTSPLHQHSLEHPYQDLLEFFTRICMVQAELEII
jgi:hypothetical protein